MGFTRGKGSFPTLEAPTSFNFNFPEGKMVMNLINGFLVDEEGAELAEYAVAVALLVAIALVVYKTLGNAINDQNSGTGAKVLETTTFTP